MAIAMVRLEGVVLILRRLYRWPAGDTFRISDIVMGMGILAVGSSVPELISGVINARNGKDGLDSQNHNDIYKNYACLYVCNY